MSSGTNTAAQSVKPSRLSEVASDPRLRIATGIDELDAILGGPQSPGAVAGSLMLLGGDPGIGKSTLALQAALAFSSRGMGVLYISGEESLPQIRMRADRLGSAESGLQVLAATDLDIVVATLESSRPKFAVIDSIQTMFSESSQGVAGGVGQVSNACNRIMQAIKRVDCATLIIGHVTKDGNLAGPRLLEHMVDVVMYLEGDRSLPYRILRCTKNRFGPTDEVGVFDMQEAGMRAVTDPSAFFLSERTSRKPGDAVGCTIEGTRPLLLEIQALTAKTQFTNPKRTASGMDFNRLQLITAVLQQRLRFKLYEFDVFASVAGGYRISEPGCDAAIAMAIVSSFTDVPIPDDALIIGELGLAGDIRKVSLLDRRLREAQKMGFKRILVPAASVASLRSGGVRSSSSVVPVADLQQAAKILLKK